MEMKFSPEFINFYNKFGLQHPEFLPTEMDKVALQIFWSEGRIDGMGVATKILEDSLNRRKV